MPRGKTIFEGPKKNLFKKTKTTPMSDKKFKKWEKGAQKHEKKFQKWKKGG